MFLIKWLLHRYGNNVVDLHEGMVNDAMEPSVAFISFHKCATSFFSSHVLKNLNYLDQIDYLAYLYNNKGNVNPIIKLNGYVYGTIRLQDVGHPRYDFVKQFIGNENFFKIKHLFWTRDPRDILVSMYYSFGHTHGLSDVSDFRQYQIKERSRINKLTLDEFVLAEAILVKKKFQWMKALIDQSDNYVLLKYEDMVLRFDDFFENISAFLPLKKEFYNEFIRETRPRDVEDSDHHKRSGQVGGFENKLQLKTIDKLDCLLEDELEYFGYIET